MLRSAQPLYKLYGIQLLERKKDIICALQSHKALPGKVTGSGSAGSISSDGEPIVNGMLMAVEREWLNIVGSSSDSGRLCLARSSSQQRRGLFSLSMKHNGLKGWSSWQLFSS